MELFKRIRKTLNLKFLKTLVLLGIAGSFVFALAIIACNLLIVETTDSYVVDEIKDLPDYDVAVVLGAKIGSEFLTNRVKAAAELYKSGKVHHILVSGAQTGSYYDEPAAMKSFLVKQGIPEKDITCDFAGFRTLDSMIRAKDVFGLDQFIVVSQRYHNYRAVYIARDNDAEAIAYNAENGPERYMWHARFREMSARFVAVLDVHVWGREPRFNTKDEPSIVVSKHQPSENLR